MIIEWNGEGLPPVGCECEAKMPGALGEPWGWRRVKVAISGMVKAENECLVYDVESTRPAWTDEFRPIRSEAQLKREEAIAAMRNFATNYNSAVVIHAIEQVYDSIAAGKIPHVTLK